MYKRCFFKSVCLFLVLLFLGALSPVFGLNPSSLFVGNNRINTTKTDMVLLVTPSKNFSPGGKLTISFPDGDDAKWCKVNDFDLSATGVFKSEINISDWKIDAALPGSLTAKCYQGSGINSYDRVVISNIGELSAGVSYGVKINASGNLSTGPNIGGNNIVVELERGFVRETTAFVLYLQGLSGLVVDAFVNEDYSSVVEVLDPVVEKGIWSRVRVRILDSKGQPIPGRTVQLGLDLADLTNWEIEQPAGVTNSNGVVEGRVRGLVTGVVKVTAIDKSFSQNVYIKDTGLLTVVNVPTIRLHDLPMYTSGLSREINWNLLPGNYHYYIEVSLDPSFNTILKNSGWITQSSYTFENLEYGKAYYYRGKARNIANFESAYSNIVSSIQADMLKGVIEVLDPVVEKGIWSRVRVRVLDQFGNPMPNRKIELRIDVPDMSRWEIEQPVGLTGSNGIVEGRIRGFEVRTVKVTAVDKTTPLETYLDGYDWLQVTQLPVFNLHTLPRYSKGLSRQILWNSLGDNYEYYIEMSPDPTFEIMVRNSGWISINNFVFDNLVNEQTYFYRGKLRNSAQQESGYSEMVFSTQDNEPPVIEKVSFDVVSNRGNFVFLITDFSKVFLVNFKCISSEGILYNCGSLSSLGNFYYVSLSASDLLDYKIGGDRYLLKYCVQARDIVGNETEVCGKEEFTLDDSLIDEDLKDPSPLRDRFTGLFLPIERTLEDTIVFLQNFNIDDGKFELVSIAFLSTLIPLTFLSLLLNPAIWQALLALWFFLRYRRRNLPYGCVYDSVTKEPINRAIVRVFKGRKLFRTAVSDVYGIFTIELDPGEYHIKVVAHDYVYPTKLITGSVDRPYENIYKGGKFSVNEKSYVQYAIPLDPLNASNVKYARAVFVNRAANFFLVLQKILIVVGLLISFLLYIRNPDTLNLIIMLSYIPLILFHLILAFVNTKSKLGKVNDFKSIALVDIELGLRELEFEKLVAKRVTDEKGKYKFVVPGGKYRLEVLTPGYVIKNLQEKDLFFTGDVKKPLLINKNLVLEKK